MIKCSTTGKPNSLGFRDICFGINLVSDLYDSHLLADSHHETAGFTNLWSKELLFHLSFNICELVQNIAQIANELLLNYPFSVQSSTSNTLFTRD